LEKVAYTLRPTRAFNLGALMLSGFGLAMVVAGVLLG